MHWWNVVYLVYIDSNVETCWIIDELTIWYLLVNWNRLRLFMILIFVLGAENEKAIYGLAWLLPIVDNVFGIGFAFPKITIHVKYIHSAYPSVCTLYSTVQTQLTSHNQSPDSWWKWIEILYRHNKYINTTMYANIKLVSPHAFNSDGIPSRL